jgi:hypothetical protein
MDIHINYLNYFDIAISSFGYITLRIIWLQIQRNINPDDRGYRYLSLGVLMWVIPSVIYLIYSSNHPVAKLGAIASSTINNGFFLYALFFFDFAPRKSKWLPFFQSKSSWRRFVLVSCSIALAIEAIFGIVLNDAYGHLAYYPDIALSLFTILLIGITFVVSFIRRKLTWFAWLSVFVLLILAITQFFTFFGNWAAPGIERLIHIGSHIGLITISIASALGWVVEKSGIPNVRNMKLVFGDIKDEKLIVTVTIDSSFEKEDVKFSSAVYLSFLKFAVRKKCSNEGLPDKEYFRRIETKIREFRDKEKLKQQDEKNPIEDLALGNWPFLFQKSTNEHREKSYILTVNAKNITISKNLIHSQLGGTLKLKGLQTDPTNEIEFIKNEFKKCSPDTHVLTTWRKRLKELLQTFP